MEITDHMLAVLGLETREEVQERHSVLVSSMTRNVSE